MRPVIGPQDVTEMTVAVDPHRCRIAGQGDPLLHRVDQRFGQRIVGGLQVRRDPAVVQQPVPRRPAEPVDVDARPVPERDRAPYHVQAPEKTAQGSTLLGGPEFRPASATGAINGEAIPVGPQQRLALDFDRRHHRDIPFRELQRKRVLLQYGLVAPASGPVELDDDGPRILHADLVDAVLVAVERQQAPVGHETGLLDRREDRLGLQVFVGPGLHDGALSQDWRVCDPYSPLVS
jgi:hypothetical protein